MCVTTPSLHFFFFNDTATTEIYTLSLHDALPIYFSGRTLGRLTAHFAPRRLRHLVVVDRESVVESEPLFQNGRPDERRRVRSEEHTSELQSQSNLVCRLLLEKKKRMMLMVLLLCQ